MEERKLHPFSFDPIEETTAWGRVKWAVADLGVVDSGVRGGWLDGNSFGEVMETYMERVVGDGVYDWYGRQFPLLVKEISAAAGSPLMVCPDDDIAAERYDALGKVKFWYVTAASPGAVIYHGLRRDLTAVDFYEACSDGSIMQCMMPHKAEVGDAVLIEPGELHALGKGVTVVEIAESSVLDINVYGSEDSEVAEALDFVRLAAGTSHSIANVTEEASRLVVKLAECTQFIVGRITLRDALSISNNGEEGYSILYYCVSGGLSVQLRAADGKIEYLNATAGHAVLVPAEVSDFRLVPVASGTVLLETMAKERVREDGYIDPSAEPTLDE